MPVVSRLNCPGLIEQPASDSALGVTQDTAGRVIQPSPSHCRSVAVSLPRVDPGASVALSRSSSEELRVVRS